MPTLPFPRILILVEHESVASVPDRVANASPPAPFVPLRTPLIAHVGVVVFFANESHSIEIPHISPFVVDELHKQMLYLSADPVVAIAVEFTL